MKNKKYMVGSLLLSVLVIGCSEDVMVTKRNVASDLDVITTGIKYFHGSNKGESCPSVTRLLADGFINRDAKGYGSLKNNHTRYQVKSNSSGNCDVIARELTEDVCLIFKDKLPPENVAHCDDKNVLRFQVKSNN